jgi:hypothetical protein
LDYDITTEQMNILLHNGKILCAVFYSPIFFPATVSLETVRTQWTPDQLAHLLPRLCPGAERPVALLIDNTEFECQRSNLLALSHATYSDKISGHSLKLFIVVAANGVILDRSWVFGGRTSETKTMDQAFADSTLLQDLVTQGGDCFAVFADRGFRSAKQPIYGRWIWVVPALLQSEKGFSVFSERQIAASKVISEFRTWVEVSFRRLDEYTPTSPLARLNMLFEVEFVIDNGVANANRRILYPSNKNLKVQQPSKDLLRQHFEFAHKRALRLVAVTQPPAILLQQPSQAPEEQREPADAFRRLLAGFPHNWPAWLLLRQKRAVAFSARLASPLYLELSREHMLWPLHKHLSKLPDHRAQQLTQSNHLLLLAIRELEGSQFLLCAEIGASFKAESYGVFVNITYLPNDQISLTTECSCLQGYAGITLFEVVLTVVVLLYQAERSVLACAVSVPLP